jgi:hypothetical protein
MAITRLCSIPDCGKTVYARGWCASHYNRWRNHGDPTKGIVGTPKGEVLRFINETVIPYEGDECIIWPYATTIKGYGQMTIGGIHGLAHRFICDKVNGPPSSTDLDAAHSCGNGHLGCVTKGHLSWKTRIDNLADMVEHGTRRRGDKCWNSKLTIDDVREIRSLRGKIMQSELARRFGVSVSLISQTQLGKNRAWVD